MLDLLPPGALLSAFLIASLVLAVTPGPGVFYIVTRSMLHGRRTGLASVAGVALGNLGNACGAALGLAALFAASSLAFSVVKYAGALYLVYLGLQALRRTRSSSDTESANRADTSENSGLSPSRLRRIFRDGFAVALLNPKTALFFAAFLPQFMSADRSALAQSTLLGSIFVAIAAVTDTVYALAAGAVAPALQRARGVRAAGRFVTAGSFIGLGLYTALSGNRAKTN